ncbi:MAG: hypothetical protein GY787_17275 [Alteromonadales bacterium]|nr:hypothetical protein [Alteromonadales bacterium]
MAYWVNHLMGNSTIEYPLTKLDELYSELTDAQSEHTDVSLTHESEWCLSAFSSGLLVWENVAGDGVPKHMSNITKGKVIELWSLLATGNIDKINNENWSSGYGS